MKFKIKINDVLNTKTNQKENVYINKDTQEAKEVYSNVGEYSITPRTFEEREFNQSINNIEYQDTFKHTNKKNPKGIEVKRFGINADIIKLDNNQTKISYELEGQKLTEGNDVIKIGQDTNGHSVVVPLAVSVASSKYSLKDAQAIEHYNIEKVTVKKAVDYLFSDTNNQMVLIDIFARLGGVVKIEKKVIGKDSNNKDIIEYHPEVHTVVLYKNPAINGKHEIVVIDPSNLTFSSHLANSELIAYLRSDNIVDNKLDTIKTSHKSLKIYQPKAKENPSPEATKYRDCIDIAVKICLAINERNKKIDSNTNLTSEQKEQQKKIDLEKITTVEEIVAISNTAEIDKYVVKDVPNRIKQSSEYKIVDAFNAVERAIELNLLKLNQDPSAKDLVSAKRNEHKKILLDKSGSYLDLVEELSSFNQSCIDTLKPLIDEPQKLIGNLLKECHDLL